MSEVEVSVNAEGSTACRNRSRAARSARRSDTSCTSDRGNGECARSPGCAREARCRWDKPRGLSGSVIGDRAERTTGQPAGRVLSARSTYRLRGWMEIGAVMSSQGFRKGAPVGKTRRPESSVDSAFPNRFPLLASQLGDLFGQLIEPMGVPQQIEPILGDAGLHLVNQLPEPVVRPSLGPGGRVVGFASFVFVHMSRYRHVSECSQGWHTKDVQLGHGGQRAGFAGSSVLCEATGRRSMDTL